MNRAEEKFGVYGVQNRARRVAASATVDSLGEDAVPFRRPSREAPRTKIATEPKAGDRSYRVRESGSSGKKEFLSETKRRVLDADEQPSRARVRREGYGPDQAHNSDDIFLGKRELNAKKLEAYRLARRRKTAAQLRRALTMALVLTVFVAAAGTAVYHSLYQIEEVTVEGAVQSSESEIRDAAALTGGTRLYSFSSRVLADRITFRCPYVKSLTVTRLAPHDVRLTVKEDTPLFYAELYGEYRVLSDSMRVLDRTEAETASAQGLTRLYLPAVQEALAGRVISFSDARIAMRIREVITALAASSLCDRITAVDLRDGYSLSVVCDGQYLLDFGSGEDMSLKLRVAEAVLADDLFETRIRAYVDLRSLGATSVLLDDQLKLIE